jgi:hypothetical protein
VPNVQENRNPPRGAVAQKGLQSTIDQLHARIAVMQAWIDAEGRKWLAGLPASIFSAESAASAQATYDMAWFRNSVFSANLKRDIARSLIELTRPYPFIDQTVWNKIAGDQS